eukprot:1116887-Alexandrium_andersonii.AAC.1
MQCWIRVPGQAAGLERAALRRCPGAATVGHPIALSSCKCVTNAMQHCAAGPGASIGPSRRCPS